jgi:hypothetical protein
VSFFILPVGGLFLAWNILGRTKSIAPSTTSETKDEYGKQNDKEED